MSNLKREFPVLYFAFKFEKKWNGTLFENVTYFQKLFRMEIISPEFLIKRRA